jgi:nicotinamidase-related amidase
LGTEFHDDVKSEPGEIVIVKRRVSAFYHTDLRIVLSAYNATTIILSGVATNYVVEGTARDAADAGYFVIVAEDCCSTVSEDAHQSSLASLSQLAIISTSDEIAQALN